MYQFLALANGVIIAVMITLNGGLSQQYSAYTAAAIIHLVGSLFAGLLWVFQKRKRPLWGHRPGWIYLGGAIGVCTTVFQNMAFGHISITSVIALGLLGQTVMSFAIDAFGLFGMEKRAFPRYAWIGLVFSALGILVMVDTTASTAVLAVGLSFVSGISMVLSRTVNARLAEKTGSLQGSLVNHLVGLPITLLIAVMVSSRGGTAGPAGVTVNNGSVAPWIFLGGVLGVLVVMVLNIIVPKVSAFQLTLLAFVGQVFAGMFLDILVGGSYSQRSFRGGLFIAFGMAVNMILDRVIREKKQCQT